MRNFYIFIGVLGVIILIILTIGFVGVSNPFLERDKTKDQLRVQNIRDIQNTITEYYNQNYSLPKDVPTKTTYGNNILLDPDSKQPYEYKAIDTIQYELCAVFATSTQSESDSIQVRTSNLTKPILNSTNGDMSQHPKGHYCMTYKACGYNCPAPTPMIYPPVYQYQTDPKQTFPGQQAPQPPYPGSSTTPTR